MLARLKLKYRIYLGFITVGIIAAAVAVTAVSGFYYVNHNFRIFLAFSENASLISNISYDVSEIQRQALIYTYEGHENSAAKVHELYQQIVRKMPVDRAQESVYLQKISRHLAAYIDTFSQVEKQRRLQYELLNKIRNAASQAEQHFQNYMEQDLPQQKQSGQLENQRVFNALLSVEKYAMRYFDSLDAGYIDAAKRAIAQVHQHFWRLNRQEQDIPPELRIAHQFMEQYEQIFLEAVQRKRGYLFLVNVVMSAEAYEVLYYSKKMTADFKQKMAVIETGTQTLMQRAILLIIVASISFVVLMVLLSWFIAQSITQPIMRLTATFNELAQGSLAADIPVYAVDDEIGALTKAAAVFRNKNQQTEELLAKSKRLMKDLERSNDELEQFVYTVSHDLKSPLVTSMGFIGIIQKLLAAGKTDEGIAKFDKVINANRRMGQLINDLLELSRVGRIDMDKKVLDLNRLLQTFVEDNAVRLKEAAVTLQIAADLPMLLANESRILQVFENLLSNTLKYGKNPNGTVISIGKQETAEEYLIYFKDNGTGIAPEYHQKVFGLFYRLNPEMEGTGIGLAVAVKVMKFHNGKIWVESDIGQGACFWLAFPKHSANNEQVE